MLTFTNKKCEICSELKNNVNDVVAVSSWKLKNEEYLNPYSKDKQYFSSVIFYSFFCLKILIQSMFPCCWCTNELLDLQLLIQMAYIIKLLHLKYVETHAVTF